MKNTTASYNERSWSIDLIGHIKSLATAHNRSIKDAGGEQTVSVDGGSLFPDVLLFGDRETARILQGWELKMPDTSISDREFRENAEIKANALGLDSFLLWNVTHAHLYVRNVSTSFFMRSQTWDNLADITTRSAVSQNRARWESLATDIFNYLNDLFDRGELEGRPFIEAYRSGGVTALILENAANVKEALVDAMRRDSTLRNNVVVWWNNYRAEYGGEDKEQVLAKAVISNWIGKLLFAHILRETDTRAQSVSTIGDETTPVQALAIFRQLSEDCNFWTIFSDSLGLSVITTQAWNQLKQFNRLLSDLRLGAVDQAQLSGLLEATVEVATRKLRGQYPTPIELASLLVQICMRNVLDDRLLDPCCGSGTIARAALELKLSNAVDAESASQSIFAGDQDPQAIQIATFALAKPGLMHVPLRIFQKDAFTLRNDTVIDFRNPSTGQLFSETLGQFEAITSNLPFVAQAGREQYGNALRQIVQRMGMANFSKRADVAAYLPFSLHSLLSENGRLGIIITNAWLGTDWGDDFYNLLGRYYDLKCVITSGAGRWFNNSEVVTNLLIMDKKTDPEQESGDIKYIVLTRPLEAISDEAAIQLLAAQIELGQTQNDSLIVRSVSPVQIAQFRALGLGGNAQFVNCDWILDFPLVPLRTIFNVKRGERRGMNELFYPKAGHGIEQEYIRPLAKSPSDFVRLSMPAVKEAFCCSRTEAELIELGHSGALNWIRQFNTAANITKLSKAGLLWYEMDTDNLSDLVMFINFGDRLFVGRVDPPAFCDQRLVPLTPLNGADIELYHALVNSAVSMFIIEGMGFGRGLGALDLSSDRIKQYMHVLDITGLSNDDKQAIKDAFQPLARRVIMSSVADELEQADRILFDDTVLAVFNINVNRQTIYDSLLTLVEIRLTANSK
ncbi:N-6 DNA methylase [Mucilaginibacter glaciei]|uniref:SAM-dependent DNA methyltransferase n=1 Tax=Mucilaginibacter glaciei TaxID=2772109 RepID=A0A926NQJ2_9SPHI|nr:N-6 DNA methylase [Mucilaginibacter glaciei]MBD1395496.1 SAM-dependent DNA methyltransferase [Mucilaginibacter glaciei]